MQIHQIVESLKFSLFRQDNANMVEDVIHVQPPSLVFYCLRRCMECNFLCTGYKWGSGRILRGISVSSCNNFKRLQYLWQG